MGWIKHNAIIVTGQDPLIETVHAKAVAIGAQVSSIVGPVMNGYRTFLVAPDGSKEGWRDSEIGDERRDSVVEYLKSLAYDDGSSPVDWLEVQYAECSPAVTRSSRK